MSKIAILSDTHGYIDDAMIHHLQDVDEIWHAGDFGSEELSDRLAALAPLRGVYGNIDGHKLRLIHPEIQVFQIDRIKVLMIHIGGYPPRYSPRVSALLDKDMPDLYICGHSHIVRVMRDTQRGLLHINPGAAGKAGFHKVRTMMTLEINKGKMENLNLIELGKRGAL